MMLRCIACKVLYEDKVMEDELSALEQLDVTEKTDGYFWGICDDCSNNDTKLLTNILLADG